MKKPKKLDMMSLDFSADEGREDVTYLVTEENFNILISEHNNLVEVVNILIAYHPEQKAIEFLLREE